MAFHHPVGGLGFQHPVVDARFCVQQPTVLVLKEKFFSWTGDSATIKDQTGTMWFKVNPKLFSLREKRIVEDAYGKPAFAMKAKMMSLHNTWELYRGNSYDKSEKVCDVKFSLASAINPDVAKLMGTSVKVYLNDGDKEPDYIAEGNFRSKRFTIFKLGPGGTKTPVAKIEKESRFSSISAFIKQNNDSHTYFLECEPGADAAFMTGLAIVIDEGLRDGDN